MLSSKLLTIYLPTWRMWWAPNNASKGRMGFDLAFKRLNALHPYTCPGLDTWSNNGLQTRPLDLRPRADIFRFMFYITKNRFKLNCMNTLCAINLGQHKRCPGSNMTPEEISFPVLCHSRGNRHFTSAPGVCKIITNLVLSFDITSARHLAHRSVF